MSAPSPRVPKALRAPRAAGVAGIIFALLIGVAMVLSRTAFPTRTADPASWEDLRSHRQSVLLAINLLPYAAIAFLWFMGVIRSQVGELEDRFFATVFLGSGLLMLATIIVFGAITAALVQVAAAGGAYPADVWGLGQQTTHDLLHVYAWRMAAVFIVSTTTIVWRTATVPGWLVVTGYLVAIVLLVAVEFEPWLALLFPTWVLLLSIQILRSPVPA